MSDLPSEEPRPTPTAPEVSPLESMANAIVGSVYNPENPSGLHRMINSVRGIENPPQMRLDAVMPQAPGKVSAQALKTLEERVAAAGARLDGIAKETDRIWQTTRPDQLAPVSNMMTHPQWAAALREYNQLARALAQLRSGAKKYGLAP